MWQRIVLECKVLRDSDRKSLEGTIEAGVKQTLDYMTKSGAETGHLVMMDRRSKRAENTPEKAADGLKVWLL